jgi:hypothetical protein
MERPPMAELVTQRLRGAFGPTYLTLMSVIQGVAMAALATRVGDTANRLTLADWILVGNTFLIFVAIWNEYLVAALAYAWIPTFLDSLLPFLLLAAELFLARFVAHDVRGWLLAMAGASLAAMVGLTHTVFRMRTADRSSQEVYAALQGDQYLNIASTAAGACLFLAAGLLYDVAGLNTMPLVVVIAATAVVSVYVSRSAVAWSRIQSFLQMNRNHEQLAVPSGQLGNPRRRALEHLSRILESTPLRRHPRPRAGS